MRNNKTNEHTNRHSFVRKLLTGICILLLVLLIADIFAGNYLVTFAIARKDGVNSKVAPTPVTQTEAQQIIDQNVKAIYEDLDEWQEASFTATKQIHSHDGLQLEADYYETDPSSHRYAILIHGYTGNRAHMRPYGKYYQTQGYNLLMPDLRSHGGSEGDYIGMGWLDKDDIVKWIDLLVAEDPDAQIILHGVSMGGATVLMTSGEQLPSNVKAIVDDCGYTSVWDIFSDEVQYLFHIPTFPVLNTASQISKLRAGYTFTEASSLEQVKKTNLPIFFTHGSLDNFVHTEMVYELYEACPTAKELYVVEGAGHGQAMYMDPDLYFDKIFSFLDQFVD